MKKLSICIFIIVFALFSTTASYASIRLSGIWESQHTSASEFSYTNGVHGSTIIFSGNNFSLAHTTFGILASGTYSISRGGFFGYLIEMNFLSGNWYTIRRDTVRNASPVRVFNFQRTQNTIIIEGTVFTRQGKPRLCRHKASGFVR